MTDLMIQQVWLNSYVDFQSSIYFQSDIQRKAYLAILDCKSGKLGVNISRCPDCRHMEFHSNSCRNWNCPNCQTVQKEIWVDRRRADTQCRFHGAS